MSHDGRPLVQPFHNLGVQDSAELLVAIKQEKIPNAVRSAPGTSMSSATRREK